MKKIAIAIATTLMLTTGAYAGGLWDMVKNAGSSGTLETKQFELEVAGTNTRAYVINVPQMNSICLLTYSSKGTPALACKTEKEMQKL